MFLRQRLAVAVQRGNACMVCSPGNIHAQFPVQPVYLNYNEFNELCFAFVGCERTVLYRSL